MSKQPTLFTTIIKEIRNMPEIEIEASGNYSTNFNFLRSLGEIVVKYKKEEQTHEYLGGLLKLNKHVTLSSLDDIRKKLSQNPEIGDPVKINRGVLTYNRFLGSFETDLYVRKNVDVFERVLVREEPYYVKSHNRKRLGL
jgi:hypothetical protein